MDVGHRVDVMRNDATIRRDAEMWALVAELEAVRATVRGFEAFNEFSEDGSHYGEEVFHDCAEQMEGIAKKLREV